MHPPGRPVSSGALEARAVAGAVRGCNGRLASCEREREMAEQPFPMDGEGRASPADACTPPTGASSSRLSSNSILDSIRKSLKRLLEWRRQMEPRPPPLALIERLKVPKRLGVNKRPEGPHTRDFKIVPFRRIHGQLKEDAGIGSAFVQLAGGVQEARSKPDGRRDL